jgi:hypothetical protein
MKTKQLASPSNFPPTSPFSAPPTVWLRTFSFSARFKSSCSFPSLFTLGFEDSPDALLDFLNPLLFLLLKTCCTSAKSSGESSPLTLPRGNHPKAPGSALLRWAVRISWRTTWDLCGWPEVGSVSSIRMRESCTKGRKTRSFEGCPNGTISELLCIGVQCGIVRKVPQKLHEMTKTLFESAKAREF